MLEEYNYNDEPSGRVDTLAMALDKCERLEKKLKIAVEGLKDVIETTKTGFVVCDACGFQGECRDCVAQIVAEQTLDEIKELEK